MSLEGIQKGHIFCQKWYVNKKGKALDLGVESPGQAGLEFSFPLIIEIQLKGVQVKGVTNFKKMCFQGMHQQSKFI